MYQALVNEYQKSSVPLKSTYMTIPVQKSGGNWNAAPLFLFISTVRRHQG